MVNPRASRSIAHTLVSLNFIEINVEVVPPGELLPRASWHTQKRPAERTSSVQWLFGVYSLFGAIFGICVNLFYIHFQYYYNNMYLIQRYLLDFDLVHCALSTFTHLFARLVVGCGLKRADAAGKRKLCSQSCMFFFWVS